MEGRELNRGVEIPRDVLELIRRLYPDGHYFGSWDHKPDWSEFDFENVISLVTDRLRNDCRVHVRSWWDRNYYSALTIFVSEFEDSPLTYELGNLPEVLEHVKETGSPLHEMNLQVSIVGPYATFPLWTRYSLGPQGQAAVSSSKEPPTNRFAEVVRCLESTLSDFGIRTLPERVLRSAVPDLGPGRVTVYHCLFHEKIGEVGG